MAPNQFEYQAPQDIEEAVRLLQQNDQARLLAGGHELIPQIKLGRIAPPLLIDLRHIPELRGITHKAGESHLSIGAMVTCNELASNAAVQADCEALVEAAKSIGDAQVRNRTTIGGNLAGGDPAADLAAAVLVLEAVLHVVGPYGPREIDAEQFLVGPYSTDLQAGEIIKEVIFPVGAERRASTYEKIKIPANSYPLCGVAAAVTMTEKKGVESCRVALTGAAAHPIRLFDVEAGLTGGNPTPKKIAA
ncbi:FAD binding domain-containing protein, partial [Gemmatimonadota bacterium]